MVVRAERAFGAGEQRQRKTTVGPVSRCRSIRFGRFLFESWWLAWHIQIVLRYPVLAGASRR